MSTVKGVSEKDREFILSVLQRLLPDNTQSYFFGSRLNGTFNEGSDLDLLIKTDSPLKLGVLAEIKDAFEESNLPFKVDILDDSALSPAMRGNIMKHAVLVFKK